jgi:hypothetical protein
VVVLEKYARLNPVKSTTNARTIISAAAFLEDRRGKGEKGITGLTG